MRAQQHELKAYNDKPDFAYNRARQAFNVTKKRTVVVEGESDKDYFERWVSGCKFHACSGKDAVIGVYEYYRRRRQRDLEFMCFVVDLDYDRILGGDLIEDECFIYNSLSSDVVFNDLEVFLVNTEAFEKVLSQFGFDDGDVSRIRHELRDASSVLGSFRAADFFVRRNNGLSRSVLNGLNVTHCFDANNIYVDPGVVGDVIGRSSGYGGLYLDELIDKARHLRNDYCGGWELSRGHDVTDMLSLFLREQGVGRFGRLDLEILLRRECEKSSFEGSPVGRRFCAMGF